MTRKVLKNWRLLHARTRECFFADVEIDMSATHWFDADMCAALGVILYHLGKQFEHNQFAQYPASELNVFFQKTDS